MTYRITSVALPTDLEAAIEAHRGAIMAAQHRVGLPCRKRFGASRALVILARLGLELLQRENGIEAVEAPEVDEPSADPPKPPTRDLVRSECPYDDPPEGSTDAALLGAMFDEVEQSGDEDPSEDSPEDSPEAHDTLPAPSVFGGDLADEDVPSWFHEI